jgi:hypothetical protein
MSTLSEANGVREIPSNDGFDGDMAEEDVGRRPKRSGRTRIARNDGNGKSDERIEETWRV